MKSPLVLHAITYCITFIWLSEQVRSVCNETFNLRVENIKQRVAVVIEWKRNSSGSLIYLYHSEQNISCNQQIESLHTKGVIPYSVNKSDDIINNCTGKDSITCLKYYENVPKGFYCAIKTIPHQYCTLYTPTLSLEDFKTPPIPHPIGLQSFAITAVTVILIAIIFVIIFTILRIRTRQHEGHLQNNSESIQKLIKVPIKNKIFVVYHRDSDHHFEMVKLFVQLLQTTFDWPIIVDYNHKDAISTMGITAWVKTSISSCSKIIFMSSPKSYEVIDSLLHNKKRDRNESDTTESLFALAWQIVCSNNLYYDYSKVYNVRFRSTKKIYATPVIVPHTQFEIPTHLTELVKCLTFDHNITETHSYSNNYFENDIKSSPLYGKLITAVLPIRQPGPILEGHSTDDNDETWISPGL